MRRRNPFYISMVERAVIAEKWRKSSIDAKINAWLGDDSDRVVDLAGRMFYVALGAARIEDISEDDLDVRIIRGAVNAVYDQAGQPEVARQHRASIASGLEAVSRFCKRVKQESLTASACDLELKLRFGDVYISDFDKLMGAIA